MSRVVEIRTYTLKPGMRGSFERLFAEQSRPMLERWGVDVIGFGVSLHDENTYFLMRAYESIEECRASEEAFYGSEEWRQGPREAILDCIETYLTVVVSLEEETIAGLRRMQPKEGHA